MEGFSEYRGGLEKKICYQANPEYMLREIAGEFILVPTGAAATHFNGVASLNETGCFLWKQLAEERTRKDLYAVFAQKYELSEEQSKEDVDDFLKSALEHELIFQR